MRQKVGIALTIAREASVLFLDEPTSGLDPLASHEFSQLLTSLSADGVAILMVTHDLFRAREVAHQIGIMKAGMLVTELAAQEVTPSELEEIYMQAIAAGSSPRNAFAASAA
jgi:ABC-2 type transport system ATP-binding protein